MSMRSPVAVVALLAAILFASCGEPRREGDPDGRPVVFAVLVEKPFFTTMANRQARPSAGIGVGAGSGGMGVGLGMGLSFSSTHVYLLAGDEAGQAGLFRKELSWGENTFTTPLRPGRTLVLTVQAEGGRQGWETVGTVRIPEAPAVDNAGSAAVPRIRVTLTKDGPHITAPGQVEPAPAPAAPAP